MLSLRLQSVGVGDRDVEDIEARGMTLERVDMIVRKLRSPPQFVHLERAATLHEGVNTIENVESIATEYDALAVKPGKLTPMSGVASRMFGFLHRYLAGQSRPDDLEKIGQFIAGLDCQNAGPRFAFLEPLAAALARDGHHLVELIAQGDHRLIVEYTLSEKGLGFATRPKGVIPFHRRDNRPITALEEHMREAVAYGDGRIHCTVSPEHEPLFGKILSEIRAVNPTVRDVVVGLSNQATSTDSVALDVESGKIVRDGEGKIVFFPAGHGSLIENLAKAGGPVFLRNVDNVPRSDRAQHLVDVYHRAFAVLLARAKLTMARLLEVIDQGIGDNGLAAGLLELEKQHITIPLARESFAESSSDKKRELVRRALKRPIKIVGVVKNEGEPGGGPFIIRYLGAEIVSIVEKDEIDEGQWPMMREGEFFNPVDILADPTDYNNQPLPLYNFVNQARCFIVRKTYRGRDVVRYENPGLWNGAMDGWISRFVVIPIETFAPVKEVVDLLRPQHQG